MQQRLETAVRPSPPKETCNGIVFVGQFLIDEGQRETPAEAQVVLVWQGNVAVGGFEVFGEVFFLRPSRKRMTVYFSCIYTNIRAVLQRSAEANELECGAQFLGVDEDGLSRGHRASPSH